MRTIAFEMRDAARLLVRNRAYTAAVVLLLALGIGVSTGVFSFVDAVLLKPFPFRQPDRLVIVWAPHSLDVHVGVGSRRIENWRERNHVFTGLSRFILDPIALSVGPDQARVVQGSMVGVHAFSVLGVPPERGRALSAADDLPGASPVAVISDSFWRSLGGPGASVIGKAIELNGKLYTVVGVMPRHFFFPNERTQVWIPLPQGSFASGPVQVLARLRPHVGVRQAQAELARLDALSGMGNAGHNAGPGVFSLYQVVLGPYREALWTLLAAALALLLIACSNVTNLLLARGIGREHELAIRASLGAGRATMVRLLLAESFLLALLGGLLGVACAWGCVRAFLLLHLADLPRIHSVSINLPVILFALLLSLLSGALCGLLPARRACGPNLIAGLQLGRQGTQSKRHASERSQFVAVEVALALALLAASGLLASSFLRLTRFNWGFDPGHLALLDMSWTSPSAHRGGLDPTGRLQRALALLPGVAELATGSGVPLDFGYTGTMFSIHGRMVRWSADRTAVSPGYFHTLRIGVLRGRVFNQEDAHSGKHNIVVEESFAKRLWPGQNPIGKNIQFLTLRPDLIAQAKRNPRQAIPFAVQRDPSSWIPDGPPWRVIGEVANVRMYSLAYQPTPNLYVPESPEDGFYPVERILLRTSGTPEDILPLARRTVLRREKDAVILNSTTMSALVSGELGHGGSDQLLLVPRPSSAARRWCSL